MLQMNFSSSFTFSVFPLISSIFSVMTPPAGCTGSLSFTITRGAIKPQLHTQKQENHI